MTRSAKPKRPHFVTRKGAYGIRTRAAAVRGRCPRPLDECAGRFSVARAGQKRPMLGRWRKKREEHRAADPREAVEEGGTVMAAPGGAPQEDTSPEERRAQERS